jgi:hypothetical protein
VACITASFPYYYIEKHRYFLRWAAAGYAWDNSLKTEKNIGNNIG